MSLKALEHYLQPLQPFLQSEGVTEVCVNRPQEIFIEKYKQFECHVVNALTHDYLQTLAQLVAEYNHQEISPERPLLSASLPSGERAQFVISPACENKQVVVALRRQQMKDLRLEDYSDAFTLTNSGVNIEKQKLAELYQQKNWLGFLSQAIKVRKNILISGGTGTGKTTFLNACLKLIPKSERLITIEDTREVNVMQPNSVHLLTSRGQQSLAKTSMQDLFECCLRLRPDRILLSELRGEEAFAFLRAANSGHPGSLSTVHADTPEACFKQLIFMLQQAGITLSEERLLAYIQSIIPIVVQLKRSESKNQHTTIAEIYYDEFA